MFSWTKQLRVHIQVRLRCNSFQQAVVKICEIQKVIQHLQVFLPFGLVSVPKLFTKILNVPIALLRRINIWITFYPGNMLLMRWILHPGNMLLMGWILHPDNMLLMGWILQKIMTARDTMIFLLRNLHVSFRK